MTNLRKWKKLAHTPSFPTSIVKPKSYGDKTQMSFIRKTCIAFFPKWSLNFQIADTCTHCVPIFVPEILRVRIFVNIMQIRVRNEERMGRGSKKTDYGGFIVLQIPVPEKREILIGWLPVNLLTNPSKSVVCISRVNVSILVSIENSGLRGGSVAGLQWCK